MSEHPGNERCRTIHVDCALTSSQREVLEEALDRALYEFGFEETYRRLTRPGPSRQEIESAKAMIAKSVNDLKDDVLASLVERGEQLRAEGKRRLKSWTWQPRLGGP